MVASGPLGVENRIGLFSVPRPSFGPLRDLLTCDKGRSSPRRGERSRWLDEQKHIQTSILDWLSHRVISGRLAGQPIGDFNRIAAIEILRMLQSSFRAPHLSSVILPIRSAIIIFTQYRSLACSRWARARTRSQLRRTSSGSMANQEISSPSLAGERDSPWKPSGRWRTFPTDVVVHSQMISTRSLTSS